MKKLLLLLLILPFMNIGDINAQTYTHTGAVKVTKIPTGASTDFILGTNPRGILVKSSTTFGGLVSLGNVSTVGVPVNTQLGVWTGDGTLKGDVNLNFDSSILEVGLSDTTLGTLNLYGDNAGLSGLLSIWNGATGDTDDEAYNLGSTSGVFSLSGNSTGDFIKYTSATQVVDILGAVTSDQSIANINTTGNTALPTKEYTDGTYATIASCGGAGFESNATATTISVSGTYYKVLGTTTNTTLIDFTHANNRLTYTGTATKEFNLNASLSMITGGSNVILAFKFAKNGTVISYPATRKVGTGTDIGSASIAFNVSLATNDYIEIFCTNESDTNTVTVEDLFFSVNSQ